MNQKCVRVPLLRRMAKPQSCVQISRDIGILFFIRVLKRGAELPIISHHFSNNYGRSLSETVVFVRWEVGFIIVFNLVQYSLSRLPASSTSLLPVAQSRTQFAQSPIV